MGFAMDLLACMANVDCGDGAKLGARCRYTRILGKRSGLFRSGSLLASTAWFSHPSLLPRSYSEVTLRFTSVGDFA